MLKKNVPKNFLYNIFYYYVIYFALYHLIDLGTLSIFTFFHFLLKHNFHIIDDWVVRHSWESILFSKLISLYFIHKILISNYKKNSDWFREIRDEFRFPPIFFFIIIVVFHIFWIYLTKVQFNPAVHNLFFLHFFTYFGVAIFYLSDLYILKWLQDICDPVEKSDLYLIAILISILSYVGNSLGIPFTHSLKFIVLLNFMFMFTLQLFYPKTFWWNIFFVLLFLAPSAIWWGFDPIREDRYTFFKVEHWPNVFEWAPLLLLAMAYLIKKLKSNESSKFIQYNENV